VKVIKKVKVQKDTAAAYLKNMSWHSREDWETFARGPGRDSNRVSQNKTVTRYHSSNLFDVILNIAIPHIETSRRYSPSLEFSGHINFYREVSARSKGVAISYRVCWRSLAE
jgi:hypothetical protein